MDFPQVRVDGLIIEQLPGETLVYDESRDEVHCLHEPAKTVFNYADGSRDLTALAELSTSHTGHELGPDDVNEILVEFGGKHLLTDMQPGISRRQMIRKGAITGSAVAAGSLITSIVAPIPAYAATPTCLPAQRSCATSSQCCSSIPCTSGICCAPYGGNCTTQSDCCGGVPCNGGHCIFP